MSINKKNLQEFMKEAAYSTFEITCYMFPVEESELEDMGIDTCVNESDMVTSVVTFRGAAEGAMFISANEDLYHALAVNMLGENSAESEERDAALCEIANIVCGNIVPFFAHDDEICKIHPPEISGTGQEKRFQQEGFQNEKLRVFLDEGIADILLFFKKA